MIGTRRRDDGSDAGRSRTQAEVEIFEAEKVVVVEHADVSEHLSLDEHQTAADRVGRSYCDWRRGQALAGQSHLHAPGRDVEQQPG